MFTKWVRLKMLAKPHCTQSGFADHYPVMKNGYFMGNIPNIFRQTQIAGSMLDVHLTGGGGVFFSIPPTYGRMS